MEIDKNEYTVTTILYDSESLQRFLKVVEKFRVQERKIELQKILKTKMALNLKKIGLGNEEIYQRIKTLYNIQNTNGYYNQEGSL